MRSAVGSNAADAAPTVQTQIDRMSGIIEHQLKRAATSGGATLGQTGAKVLPLAVELRAALMRVYGGKDLLLEIDVESAKGADHDIGANPAQDRHIAHRIGELLIAWIVDQRAPNLVSRRGHQV